MEMMLWHSDAGVARYNPIHEDDIIATISKLLEVASVPAITVNWARDQTVSLGEVVTAMSDQPARETLRLGETT